MRGRSDQPPRSVPALTPLPAIERAEQRDRERIQRRREEPTSTGQREHRAKPSTPKPVKKKIRARMRRTGEKYTVARRAVLAELER